MPKYSSNASSPVSAATASTAARTPGLAAASTTPARSVAAYPGPSPSLVDRGGSGNRVAKVAAARHNATLTQPASA